MKETPLDSATEFVSQNRWQVVARNVIRSRWTFAALQILDLLTTLAAFRIGAYEVNPLVAYLTQQFGGFRGLLISKLSAVMIILGVKRLVWVVNLFYSVVVFWNCFLLLLFWMKGH